MYESWDDVAGMKLREAADRLGWTVKMEAPRWEDDTFKLLLGGVDGYPEGLDLQISQKKAWNHMDRILITFSRLAGEPVEGAGYRLKRIVPPPPLVRRMKKPEPEKKYYL